jgi:hypothetical protein
MLKQGTAAMALVATLGLVVPSSFGGTASADISRQDGIQLMLITCDFDGNASYEYTSDVIAIDHDPGGKRLGTMQDQDTRSNLAFVPMEGYVDTIFTAIDPVPPGYPITFLIPPENDYAYLGGEFNRGGTNGKKNLIDCIVVDDSPENNYPAGESEDNVTGCHSLSGVPLDVDECFFVDEDDPVTYHYKDIYTIKAEVTGNSGPAAQAAGADDGHHKAKKGGKHRHKGKHRK